MAKRMTLMLLVLGAILAGIAALKVSQIQAAIARASSWTPPPEAVTTIVAEAESWPATLRAIGTVVADQGVIVSADLPGVVERIDLESGRRVSAGEVLVLLDTRQERAQLAAAEAQRDLARLQLDRMRGLREKGVTSQADYDRAIAEARESEARVGEIEATIERKTIRAPFSGILGIRQVDRGQYLTAGAPIVPLQSLQPIHVDFAVPQQDVARLDVGTPVRITAEGPIEAAGRVTAIDSLVDAGTRNVRLRATFDNPRGALRPGMFVEAEGVIGTGDPIVSVPATAILYAPYGDSVFVVDRLDGPNGTKYQGVRQQFVKLGPNRGDRVAIVDGVSAGAEVVTSGVFKLRNGAAIEIHNDVQPGNDPAPDPENS